MLNEMQMVEKINQLGENCYHDLDKEESEQSQQLKRLKDSLEAAKEIILSKEGELAAVEQIRQERDVLAEMVRTLQEREASRPDPKQEIRDGLKRAGNKFKGLFAKPSN